MILTEKVIKLVFAKLRRKGGIDMLKNVNPLNREPENMSTAAYRCACVCYTTAGHTSPSVTAALPVTEDCGCKIAKVEITKIVWQIMELRIDLAVHTTKFKN